MKMKNNKKDPERENFCVKTSGLSKSERRDLASGLQEFVNEKKSEFTEKRNRTEDSRE